MNNAIKAAIETNLHYIHKGNGIDKKLVRLRGLLATSVHRDNPGYVEALKEEEHRLLSPGVL